MQDFAGGGLFLVGRQGRVLWIAGEGCSLGWLVIGWSFPYLAKIRLRFASTSSSPNRADRGGTGYAFT